MSSGSSRPSSRAGAVVAAAVAALALSAASAGAAPAAPAASDAAVAAESELTLSIIPEKPTAENPRTVVALDCGPAGGNHPNPEWACRLLEGVGGSFPDIPPASSMCPDVWDPVTITATGTWRGEPVDYAEDFTNRLCAEVDTNGVFAF